MKLIVLCVALCGVSLTAAEPLPLGGLPVPAVPSLPTGNLPIPPVDLPAPLPTADNVAKCVADLKQIPDLLQIAVRCDTVGCLKDLATGLPEVLTPEKIQELISAAAGISESVMQGSLQFYKEIIVCQKGGREELQCKLHELAACLKKLKAFLCDRRYEASPCCAMLRKLVHFFCCHATATLAFDCENIKANCTLCPAVLTCGLYIILKNYPLVIGILAPIINPVVKLVLCYLIKLPEVSWCQVECALEQFGNQLYETCWYSWKSGVGVHAMYNLCCLGSGWADASCTCVPSGDICAIVDTMKSHYFLLGFALCILNLCKHCILSVFSPIIQKLCPCFIYDTVESCNCQ